MIAMLDTFKRARRVSAPLVVLQTPDPAASRSEILITYADCPVTEWNSVRGLVPSNDLGRKAIATACRAAGLDDAESTTNPLEAMRIVEMLPAQSIVMFHNINRWLPGAVEDPMRAILAQGFWNLRDKFKVDRRTAVLMGQSVELPPEIINDVVVIDEPLPSPEQLAEKVRKQYSNARLAEPTADVVAKAVDALSGLAAFPAEQITAMSLSRDGVNLSQLWERKRQTIGQTPGLGVNKSGEKFADVGGCDNVKALLRRVIASPVAPRAIVWIDEIEKAMAGAGGDTSGTSQDQLGQILTYMTEQDANGCMFIGIPGSAKSMIAKALGNEAGVPTIQFDLGAMKGSLLGQSEARVRQALKVVTAVGQGRVFFVATCNSIAVLPPELRRRFRQGTFFFDVPTQEERTVIWSLYLSKFGLTPTVDNPLPDDHMWSGAEIAACVANVVNLGMSFAEAGSYIVPVARSMGRRLQELRELADGNFLSAAHSGTYDKRAAEPSVPGAGVRAITVE